LSKGLPLSQSDEQIWARFLQNKTEEEILEAISKTLADFLPESKEVLRSAARSILMPPQTPFPAPRLKISSLGSYSPDATEMAAKSASFMQDVSEPTNSSSLLNRFFSFGHKDRHESAPSRVSSVKTEAPTSRTVSVNASHHSEGGEPSSFAAQSGGQRLQHGKHGNARGVVCGEDGLFGVGAEGGIPRPLTLRGGDKPATLSNRMRRVRVFLSEWMGANNRVQPAEHQVQQTGSHWWG
jgi:hypothetical protein